MPAFAAVYTAEQREAVAVAIVDRGIKPAARVVELAAAGELTLDGARLDAFSIPVNSVRDLARQLRKRRAGELRTEAASLPPRDAVEALRRRLVSLADRELEVIESRKRGTVKQETLRQIARTVREIAAIPGPDDPRPPAPGQRKPGTGEHNGSRTTGGMAHSILTADKGSARVETHESAPATDHTPPPSPHPTEKDATHTEHAEAEPHTTLEPGAWAREQVEAQRTEQGGERMHPIPHA